MQIYRKMDKTQIAQINKYNVLHCLIRGKPINRAAIAKLTELSIPTVMSIIDDLLEKKIIFSIGKGESSGGKPPEMLGIVPDRFYYIGLDVGSTAIRVVVNDVVSRQIAYLQESTGEPFPEKQFVKRLGTLILQVYNHLNVAQDRILGVGIAMPGLIENGTGRVLFSPDFGWSNIPLRNWLQEILPFPVIIENSNRALGLNESYLIDDGDHTHTIFSVNLGYGIGGALIMGDDVYVGASGTSGEIGHITVDTDGPVCMCGNNGCLEAVASGAAIALQGRKAAEHNHKSKMIELCGRDLSQIDARLVFKAANLGDKAALEIISKAAEHIGIGLSMAINVLDPDRVLLCGGLMRNGPMFFDKIKANVQKHQMRQAAHAVLISTGIGGEYSTANGACRTLANDLWRRRALPI